MDEVDVAHGRDDEGLEGGRREALHNTGGEEVFPCDLGFADRGADDAEQGRDNEDGAFAVFAAEGADKGAGAACGEKIVPGREHDGCEGYVDFFGDGEVGGVQQRALAWRETHEALRRGTGAIEGDAYVGTGVQHGTQAKDQNDDFLLPHWPIERVIGI